MSTEGADGDSGDGVECPTCGRGGFASQRGMKQHHSMAHDESIAGVELRCDWCEGTFRRAPSKQDRARFCSNECKTQWLSECCTGEDSPAWEGGPVSLQCENCGEVCDVPSHREDEFRFCSQICQGEWLSENKTGENHPLWVERESRCCEHCGESFRRLPSSGQSFCSISCASASLELMSGATNPNWAGGEYVGEDRSAGEGERRECPWDGCGFSSTERGVKHHHQRTHGASIWSTDVSKPCVWCGKVFATKKARQSEARFCSERCYGAWRSENIRGEDHWAWKGGRFPYGAGWNEAKRETIREGQNRECAGCGTHESDLPTKLHVHHIRKARTFDDAEKRNDEANLVALCQSCHSEWEQMSPLRPVVSP